MTTSCEDLPSHLTLLRQSFRSLRWSPDSKEDYDVSVCNGNVAFSLGSSLWISIDCDSLTQRKTYEWEAVDDYITCHCWYTLTPKQILEYDGRVSRWATEVIQSTGISPNSATSFLLCGMTSGRVFVFSRTSVLLGFLPCHVTPVRKIKLQCSPSDYSHANEGQSHVVRTGISSVLVLFESIVTRIEACGFSTLLLKYINRMETMNDILIGEKSPFPIIIHKVYIDSTQQRVINDVCVLDFDDVRRKKKDAREGKPSLGFMAAGRHPFIVTISYDFVNQNIDFIQENEVINKTINNAEKQESVSGYHIRQSLTSTVFSLAAWARGYGTTSDPHSSKNQIPLLDCHPCVVVKQIEDSHREFVSIVMDPSGRYAAASDNLCRVWLLDLHHMIIIRVWKGYRDGQLGWIEVAFDDSPSSEHMSLLVVYAPRRGLLEVWPLGAGDGARIAAANVGLGRQLVYTYEFQSMHDSPSSTLRPSSPRLGAACYLVTMANGDMESITVQRRHRRVEIVPSSSSRPSSPIAHPPSLIITDVDEGLYANLLELLSSTTSDSPSAAPFILTLLRKLRSPMWFMRALNALTVVDGVMLHLEATRVAIMVYEMERFSENDHINETHGAICTDIETISDALPALRRRYSVLMALQMLSEIVNRQAKSTYGHAASMSSTAAIPYSHTEFGKDIQQLVDVAPSSTPWDFSIHTAQSQPSSVVIDSLANPQIYPSYSLHPHYSLIAMGDFSIDLPTVDEFLNAFSNSNNITNGMRQVWEKVGRLLLRPCLSQSALGLDGATIIMIIKSLKASPLALETMLLSFLVHTPLRVLLAAPSSRDDCGGASMLEEVIRVGLLAPMRTDNINTKTTIIDANECEILQMSKYWCERTRSVAHALFLSRLYLASMLWDHLPASHALSQMRQQWNQYTLKLQELRFILSYCHHIDHISTTLSLHYLERVYTINCVIATLQMIDEENKNQYTPSSTLDDPTARRDDDGHDHASDSGCEGDVLSDDDPTDCLITKSNPSSLHRSVSIEGVSLLHLKQRFHDQFNALDVSLYSCVLYLQRWVDASVVVDASTVGDAAWTIVNNYTNDNNIKYLKKCLETLRQLSSRRRACCATYLWQTWLRGVVLAVTTLSSASPAALTSHTVHSTTVNEILLFALSILNIIDDVVDDSSEHSTVASPATSDDEGDIVALSSPSAVTGRGRGFYSNVSASRWDGSWPPIPDVRMIEILGRFDLSHPHLPSLPSHIDAAVKLPLLHLTKGITMCLHGLLTNNLLSTHRLADLFSSVLSTSHLSVVATKECFSLPRTADHRRGRTQCFISLASAAPQLVVDIMRCIREETEVHVSVLMSILLKYLKDQQDKSGMDIFSSIIYLLKKSNDDELSLLAPSIAGFVDALVVFSEQKIALFIDDLERKKDEEFNELIPMTSALRGWWEGYMATGRDKCEGDAEEFRSFLVLLLGQSASLNYTTEYIRNVDGRVREVMEVMTSRGASTTMDTLCVTLSLLRQGMDELMQALTSRMMKRYKKRIK